MAAWQYDISLVPREKMLQLVGYIPNILDPVLADTVDWWKGVQLPSDYETILSGILSPGASWSKSLKGWGDYDGDRIELLYENGSVVEINVRINIIKINLEYVSRLADFAKQTDSLIVNSNLELIEANLEAILKDIKSSRAFLFLQDPKAFFDTNNLL